MTNTETARADALRKKNHARWNLMAVIVCTMINLVLLVTASGTTFLFSAAVPYYAVLVGAVLKVSLILYICLAVAGVSLLLYFVCWFFCKEKNGWLLAALIMFALDTLVLVIITVLFLEISGILNIVVHGYVIYTMVMGISAEQTLKNLPEETETEAETEAEAETETEAEAETETETEAETETVDLE